MNRRSHQRTTPSDVDPAAGIWACDRCGRRIQVITESEFEKVQAFACVCGATMRPGDEHSMPDLDLQSRVVDE